MSDFKLTNSDFDDCSTLIILSERGRQFWDKMNYKRFIVVGNGSSNIFVFIKVSILLIPGKLTSFLSLRISLLICSISKE